MEDYSLLESRLPIFLLSPTVSFSLKASTEQLGRGSCGPGVGPGRLLKYLIFSAWTMTDKKLSPVVTSTWDVTISLAVKQYISRIAVRIFYNI